MGMNFTQICRALDHVLDYGNGAVKDETPVRIYFDDEAFREVVAVYPEDINGRLVIVIKAGH